MICEDANSFVADSLSGLYYCNIMTGTTIAQRLTNVLESIPEEVTLVAVSKTKPNADILEAYKAGQRIFGENRVQGLVVKAQELPNDIQWHFIGHLQSKKVKQIAGFVSMIHAVDSLKLLNTINKHAAQHGRVIQVLLQFHIAQEDSKFGLTAEKAIALLEDSSVADMNNICIKGVMGMATNTADTSIIRKEFSELRRIFNLLKADFFKGNSTFDRISMGMSGDYTIAIEEGSNMVRIGSTIFGPRQ